MIHIILLPIGFVLGFYVAATASRWKLEDAIRLHEVQLKQARQTAAFKGFGEGIRRSRQLISGNQN